MRGALPGWFEQLALLLAAARARRRRRAEAQRRQFGSPAAVTLMMLASAAMFGLTLGGSIAHTIDTTRHAALAAGGRTLVGGSTYERVLMLAERDREMHDVEVAEQYRRGETDAEIAARMARARENREAARASLVEFARYDDRQIVAPDPAARLAHADAVLRVYADRGVAGFVTADATNLRAGDVGGGVLAALLALLWLSIALVCDTDAIDVTRRRHPMWEWYLGMPIASSVAFVAEMLAPMLGSPFVLVMPLALAAIVVREAGTVGAVLASLPVALPLTLAACLWSKAFEVLIMLRVAPRSRGAWFAFAAVSGLLLPTLLLAFDATAPAILLSIDAASGALAAARWLVDVDAPGPWLRAMALSLAIAGTLGLAAVGTLRYAVARGLEGGFGGPARRTGDAFVVAGRGRGDPIWRKEWLWLRRDRGALVQLLVLPLLFGAFIAYSGRGFLIGALTWHRLAALVVAAGAYLLLQIGPRALASEGPALLLTLSWPRSLESILRVKLRLMLGMVTAMVWLAFAVSMWKFPADAWKFAAVALLWPIYGSSVAEKAITLIPGTSSSGEPEPLPPSAAWLANVGNFIFAVGLYSGQWSLAVSGVVMNWLFAGAMWQRFRIRLDYLLDPASEPQPAAPTIIASLFGVLALLEFGAFLAAVLMIATGAEGAGYALAIGIGVAAVVVCLAMWRWNLGHGLRLRDTLRLDASARYVPVLASVAALGLGGALGLISIAYLRALDHVPWPALQEMLQASRQFVRTSPEWMAGYTIVAVAVAPWAEEYLFRGLLFRSMLRQWSPWFSALVSSAFFSVLHPAPAWPMVFVLGVVNALVFYRTRALLPCVLLHLAYNVVATMAP